MKAHRLAHLVEEITITEKTAVAKLAAKGIKTMKDLDAYCWKIAKNNEVPSRYSVLKQLVGEKDADKIMRELEVQSWKMGKGGMGESVDEALAPAQVESTDPDGEMAISQLKSLVERANNVLSMLRPTSKLEPWVQSKITLADDYIASIHDYLKNTEGAIGEEFTDFQEAKYVKTPPPTPQEIEAQAKKIVDESKKRGVRIVIESDRVVSFVKEFTKGDQNAFFNAQRDCDAIRTMFSMIRTQRNDWGCESAGFGTGAQECIKSGRVVLSRSGGGGRDLIKQVQKLK